MWFPLLHLMKWVVAQVWGIISQYTTWDMNQVTFTWMDSCEHDTNNNIVTYTDWTNVYLCFVSIVSDTPTFGTPTLIHTWTSISDLRVKKHNNTLIVWYREWGIKYRIVDVSGSTFYTSDQFQSHYQNTAEYDICISDWGSNCDFYVDCVHWQVITTYDKRYIYSSTKWFDTTWLWVYTEEAFGWTTSRTFTVWSSSSTIWFPRIEPHNLSWVILSINFIDTYSSNVKVWRLGREVSWNFSASFTYESNYYFWSCTADWAKWHSLKIVKDWRIVVAWKYEDNNSPKNYRQRVYLLNDTYSAFNQLDMHDLNSFTESSYASPTFLSQWITSATNNKLFVLTNQRNVAWQTQHLMEFDISADTLNQIVAHSSSWVAWWQGDWSFCNLIANGCFAGAFDWDWNKKWIIDDFTN